MTYETLLIDIDNTILNFKAAEEIAFRELLHELKIPYSEELKKHYHKINKKLWIDYENGVIESNVIREQRFARSLEEYKLPYTGIELDQMYRHHIEENNVLMPNALEMLEEVSKNGYKLGIVTNGVASSQYKRLEYAGIKDMFEVIAVSSEVGVAKPHLPFFEAVFKGFDSIDTSKTIILGDSLYADIQGGLNADIATCWYNPYHVENDTDFKPTYEIHDLLEFLEIVR